MTSWEYLGVIGFLGILIAFIMVTHYTIQKNLLDRLMARDFTDFVRGEKLRAEEIDEDTQTLVNL